MDDRASLDTLFAGLVAEPAQQRAPFKFLDAYGAADRALFFGRDNEIRDLYARFYQGRVLLVYGESGAGKTSLIECGLRSEIPTEEALFVTIRTAQDPFEAVRWALQRALGAALELELGALAGEVIEQKSKTLVLVFDQFEEFFLFQPVSVRQAFAQAVRDWLDQNGNLRLVIGLREEYLARATELELYWPGLFRNRLWIRHLARTDAEAAIVGPCAVCGVALEDGLVPQVLADLSGGGEVELPIFQVVLDSLYRRALAETPKRPRLTFDAYRELGQVQTILGRFLEERVQSYAEAAEAARQILKALITAEGTRQFGALQDIAVRVRQFGPELTDERVAELLRRLIGDRLVREDPDQHWYELRHDALVQQIRQWMSGLEQELVDLCQTLENRLREYQRHGRLLEADLLATLAPYESRLFLRGKLAELVELSKRRARQRKRLRFWAGTAIFSIILAFGIFSFVQWQEARSQERQAEENFKQAQLAVFDLTQVSEDTLLDMQGLEPLRKQLIEKALKYLDSFVKQRAGDVKMQEALARTILQAGTLRQSLGDHNGSEKAYRQAIDYYETLNLVHPDNPYYWNELGRSYNNLGNLLRVIGNTNQAREVFQKAVDLRKELLWAHPDPQYKSDLATSYYHLGYLLQTIGDLKEAEEMYKKTLDLQKELVQTYKEQQYQIDCAVTYNSLGSRLHLIGQLKAAEQLYQKSLELQEPLIINDSKVPIYQSTLASTYNNLGNILRDLGNTKGAKEAYQKAMVKRKELIQKHPDVPQYRNDLARTYTNLGLLYNLIGNNVEAREMLQKAQKQQEPLVQDYPNVPQYRRELGSIYSFTGRHLGEIGDTIMAREMYQKAVNWRGSLAYEHPKIPQYQNDLTITYTGFGNLLRDSGEIEKAQEAYQKVLESQERLVKVHPEVPQYRRELAALYYNLGLLLRKSGNASEAREMYEKAIGLQEPLVFKHPEVPRYQKELGDSYYSLGLLLRDNSSITKAREMLQKAIGLQEPLTRDYPEVPAYQKGLADSYHSLGLLLRDNNNAKESRDALLKASEIFTRLTHQFPDRAKYRTNWAVVEENLAWAELFSRNPQEAITAANRGLEADPNQVAIRLNLAHGYLFDNQYEKALAIYTENKDAKLADGRTFAQAVLADFKEFRTKGISHPDMEKIENLLRNPMGN